MKWHCVIKGHENEYCGGTPEWAKEPAAVKGIEKGEKIEEVRFYSGGTCKLTPETCGRRQTILEQVPPEELERINKSTYIETIVPISPEKKSVAKPKSKKTKKLEQEIAQRKML